MSEKPTKPGAIADAEALSGSDEAQAHVRRWWRLVPRTLTHPTEVFLALRDDDERSQPDQKPGALLACHAAATALRSSSGRRN